MSIPLEQLGRAANFSESKFGGPTRIVENPLTTSVGATPTLLLPNEPDRIFWLVVNRSAQIVDLGFTNALVTGANILLDANGGTVSSILEQDGELVTYPVYAVAPVAGATVYVVEVRRV